jgi:hypothetical protein
MDNFEDEKEREAAIQTFWVVYELDRRWSFGTSLPFALDDRNIDPKLPEPGQQQYPYLKALIAYARLCSKIWEALPPYGSSQQSIPKETEDYLDFIAQNWLQSLPQELQLESPRPGKAPRQQDHISHRLPMMLYLRGNYARLLIHRHHVLAPESISANPEKAQSVVEIARDSIEALVHLNATSEIYRREQCIYHYYLLSAVAVVLLAVCHNPHSFAESCRAPFVSAIELVKGFSRHSTASRRLWKGIRGLLPVVQSLAAKSAGETTGNRNTAVAMNNARRTEETSPYPTPFNTSTSQEFAIQNQTDAGFEFDSGSKSMPDIFDMSNNLMDIYDLFGLSAISQPIELNGPTNGVDLDGFTAWEAGEITRHFQDLI